MEFLIRFIDTLFDILSVAIIARILMSWFQANPTGRLYQFIVEVTSPILRTARRITPRMGMIDFSPLVALIGLDIIRYLLITVLMSV